MSKIVERGTGTYFLVGKTGAGNRACAAVAWLARVFLVGLAMMVGLTQVASATVQYTWTVNGTDVTGSATVGESAGEITVELRKTLSSTRQHSLSFSGVASRDNDFTFSGLDGDDKFNLNGTEKTSFKLTITQDQIVEGDETFTLTALDLGPSVGGIRFSTSLTITITDDDVADNPSVRSIAVDNKSFDEGNSGSTNVTATLTLNEAPTEAVQYELAVSSGTGAGQAQAGSDYTPTGPHLVTVAAGATTGTYTISVTGDRHFEPDEEIVVSIGTGDSRKSETIRIRNDDLPVLSVSSKSVTEGGAGGRAQVKAIVTLPAAAAERHTFTLSFGSTGTATRGDSATAAGADFVSEARPTITIDQGQTSGSHTLTIVGDVRVETNETIIVKLGTADDAPSETITITNDDYADAVESVTVRLATSTTSSTTLSVPEGDLNATTNVIVTLTMAATTDSVRNLDLTRGGTAAAPSDFTPNDAQPRISISAGQQEGTYTLTINGDILSEANETIEFTATGRNGATSKATITITNDDNEHDVDSVTVSEKTVTEGGVGHTTNVTVTVNLAATASTARTVSLALSGTAARGSDFTSAATPQIAIGANKTSGTYTIVVNGDILDEPDQETIVITASVVGGDSDAVTANETITIDDDDDGNAVDSLTFNPRGPIKEGNKGSQTVELTVTMAAKSSASRTVTLDFADSTAQIGTSAAQGVDFTTSSKREVTIAANATTGKYSIAILGDIVDEDNEQIFVTAKVSTAPDNSGTRSATFTITDDDTFAVRSITATPDRVSENGGTVDVVVQYTATLPAARVENVTYAGSATPGVDFTGHIASLNIPVATLTSRFRLTMVPDDLREEDETIVMTLFDRPLTVTIIDEDTGIAALDEVRQQAGAALLRRNTQRFAFMTNNLVTKRLSGQSANAVSGDGRKVFVDVGASLNALGPKAQRDVAAARDRFANVWTSVEATRLEGDVTGEVFDVYAGADFRLTPDSIVGVLVSYESADVSTEKHDGRLEADGWSVGAYAGVQLAPNLTWDLAGSYGRQTPDVYARAGIRSFYGKYTSNRYLVASHLTGHVALDNGLVVKPTVGILYGRDAQDRLTDSRGNRAAARKLELGRMSLGPQVSYSHALPKGWGVLDLTASATGFYDVLTPEAEDLDLNERLSGAFSLGLSWSDNAGTTLDLGGSIDGVGLKGYDAYNVTGKLKFDF